MKVEKLCKDVIHTIIEKETFQLKFKTLSLYEINKLRKVVNQFLSTLETNPSNFSI